MKHRKNTAFFIEALLLTLFVLALCTVLVRLFAAARLRSTQAQELTAAQQIAQNVSESFYASDSEEAFWQLLGTANPPAEGQALTLTVDSQGRPDPIGTYELELTLEHQAAQAGQTARLALRLSGSGGQVLFEGTFDRYLPGS
ncbi:MAG: hypothetical protein SOY27_07965 [Fournierella sp.]|uniref:hypothetical protein n=1 Tax=Allofournierella sp. TaxID=1940256 RepID=UPI0025C4D412|nr:hypothetical protein [Fournierella sp.]MDY4167409.1 hypothetical protein [Fournierella sp.]